MKKTIYRILKIVLFILLLPFIYICGIATIGLISFGINRIGKTPVGESSYRCGGFYSLGGDSVYWSPKVEECLGFASYKKISDDSDNFEILVDEEDLARDSKYLYGNGEILERNSGVNDIKVLKKIKLNSTYKYYDYVYLTDGYDIYIYYGSNEIFELNVGNVNDWVYLGCKFSTDGEKYYDRYRVVSSEKVAFDECSEYVE